MAIDKLQEKIRKLKAPIVVDFTMLPEHIPAHISQSAACYYDGYIAYCKELLTGLKEVVPAVRFDFNMFALGGNDGLNALQSVLQFAKEQGYYVLLDAVQSLSGMSAAIAADVFMNSDEKWQFDGLILASYIGSDGYRPYIEKMKAANKDLFIVVRTSNKSAAEIQDLLTGGRLVHVANADIVNRYTDSLIGRSGYSKLGIMSAASSADSLRTLRTKYQNMFMLLDGMDYPNSNAKNCSFAFDKLGHGAAAVVGLSVTAAWQQCESDTEDFVSQAVRAVDRTKKNLLRYISIL